MSGMGAQGSADPSRARLEIPATALYVEPALDFVTRFALDLGIDETRNERLRKAAKTALTAAIRSNAGGLSEHPIGLEVFPQGNELVVEVENRGVPLFAGNGEGSVLFPEMASHLDRLSLRNLGRRGQMVVMGLKLGEEAVKRALGVTPDRRSLGEIPDSAISIRRLEPAEAARLGELFYYVYGYDYINEWVYYPERVREKCESGELISVVAALPDGRIIGHVGLLKQGNNPPVYEPCLGVVDPGLKSRGLFGRIFDATMAIVAELPMQYCFFDFVTNHELSQKFVARYRPVDLAIFLGCQSSATQAKLERLGIGADPKESDRYSLLFSVIPRVKHPFGREIALPMGLGELLGFLLKPLNLVWYPAPRFACLGEQGAYHTRLTPSQSAVLFDLFEPGQGAVEGILSQWRQLLRHGYQYGAVEVPADAPGVGQLHDRLSASGFFVAGFVPYQNSDRLALRFQSVGPTRLAFDEVKVYSETAKRLLALIQRQYERNVLL